MSEDATFQDILETFQRDGAVIVPKMLSPEVVHALKTDLDPSVQAVQPGTRAEHPMIRSFWGANTKRFTRLAWRSPTFANHVLVHPLLLKVADAVLLPHCASYWMNTGQIMAVGPGSPAQPLHRDAENWMHFCDSPQSPEVTVSCMFALTDFKPEVGATRVVPGSQAWRDYSREVEDHEISHAVMPAGSGLIYSGKVVHSAGANTTLDEWRQGLHLSYVAGWLTPEEAGCVGVPQDMAKRMTPLQQQLLGYRCYDDAENHSVRLWTVDYEDIPVALGWKDEQGLSKP